VAIEWHRPLPAFTKPSEVTSATILAIDADAAIADNGTDPFEDLYRPEAAVSK